MRNMIGKLKSFGLGLLLGSALAFPLGMNFVKEKPLLSNPLAEADVHDTVAAKVKEGAETVLEEARVKIHEATEPLAAAN